ncbi:MAG: hydrogenase maturation nickel metallochaperone HypA [Pyrinomonadaceae bacterium]
MHELSIAMSIVEGASEEAERHSGGKVSVVHLLLGRLSGVVKEALLFSYDIATEGTDLEGSVLEIEDIDAAIFCRQCDAERTLDSIQNFACPVCGTPTSEVVRGRELLIKSLELTDEYAAATG